VPLRRDFTAVPDVNGTAVQGLARKSCPIGLRLRSALQSRELSGVETRYTGILFIGKSLTKCGVALELGSIESLHLRQESAFSGSGRRLTNKQKPPSKLPGGENQGASTTLFFLDHGGGQDGLTEIRVTNQTYAG
jgi:hypothetical protein